MKKIITPFLLAALLLTGAVLIAWNAKYTVTAGERREEFSSVTYGYRIEQYYFWNSMTLTLWNRRGVNYGMNLVYDLPSLTVDKVVEERWINHEAAIYLNLQIKYHDSAVSVNPARIIYDFQRGEMHTASGFTLWRIWNEQNKTEEWMSDSEFDVVLLRLSR